MKIIFMGSPNFAVPSLRKILATKNEVVAVYSQPGRRLGRGLQKESSTVSSYATQHGLYVLTPVSMDETYEEFCALFPDIVIVVAYGQLVPERFLTVPKYGFINVHPSSLPRWRGASPIERAIMAGDKETAVCIMKLVKELDAGDIILQQKIFLDSKTTAKELHDRASVIGADLLMQTLDLLEKSRQFISFPQSNVGITYAQKILPTERRINFSKNVRNIYNLVRSFSPSPGAYFFHKEERIKIITANFYEKKHESHFGQVIDHELTIACNGGFLKPLLLQRAGRKMLYTDAFLRGYPIPAFSQLL